MTRKTLFVFGVLFALLGLAYTLEPVSMFASSGDTLSHAASITDVRAVYGGFELGLGIFMFIQAYKSDALAQTLQLSIWIFTCLIVTRALGLALDQGEQAFNHAVLGFELMCLAWLLWVKRRDQLFESA